MPREWPRSDIKITGEHNETIAGHSVRVVTRARLDEISVCNEGCAGDDAFAVLVDEGPWLNHSHRALLGIASEIRGRLVGQCRIAKRA
jgi:hypothetical protein